MSADDNKEIVRRFIDDVWTAGNLTLLDELVSPEYLAENKSVGPGRDGLRQLISSVRAAFPDFTASIEDLIAEGDRVVAVITSRGTHRGNFNGIVATGKTVEVGSIDVYRVADGMLVQHVGRFDELGLLAQLGVQQDFSWAG